MGAISAICLLHGQQMAQMAPIIYGLWHHKLLQKHPKVLTPPICILLRFQMSLIMSSNVKWNCIFKLLYKICLKNLISDFFSFQPERKLKAGSGRTMGIQDNGRIKCIFSRKRDDYADEDEIFDLNEDHYLFLAKGKVDDRGKGYFERI